MVEKAIKPETEQTISEEGVCTCVLFFFHKCDIILELLKIPSEPNWNVHISLLGYVYTWWWHFKISTNEQNLSSIFNWLKIEAEWSNLVSRQVVLLLSVSCEETIVLHLDSTILIIAM